ncbi:MAG: phosphotransferase [Dehalococcoidales bacterium]|nr:MAG: phosphotransferase [Dehalococcoidales bacterium]
MMKLKYLFDNRELTHMILKNWDYDTDKLDILDNFRISANAVYPFLKNGEVFILRFSPVEERTADTIRAELEFLRYLRSEDYRVPDTLPSKNGNELELINTPWGDYLAVVFERVPGNALSRIEITDDILYGYGKALGELHTLSRRYHPDRYRRISWSEQLDWMERILSEFETEKVAQDELLILRSYFSGFPADDENYGLIHYDFEVDNVFYNDNDGSFHTIDFDDAHYHWFVIDIDQALDGLFRELPSRNPGEMKELFIDGYRSVIRVDESMLELLPVFRRYANLNGYIKIVRSAEEKWNHEPDWMVELRKKLLLSMRDRSADFGKSIVA